MVPTRYFLDSDTFRIFRLVASSTEKVAPPNVFQQFTNYFYLISKKTRIYSKSNLCCLYKFK